VPVSKLHVARQVFEAFDQRDAAALTAQMTDDVEFLPVTANLALGGAPYRGHDGIALYLEHVARYWTEIRVFPGEFRDLGDLVVALGRIRARGGGMIIDRPAGWLWRFRGDKIAWGRVYASHEEALQAAGAEE
jgi:ketosteroid isomerase-like protein